MSTCQMMSGFMLIIIFCREASESHIFIECGTQQQPFILYTKKNNKSLWRTLYDEKNLSKFEHKE